MFPYFSIGRTSVLYSIGTVCSSKFSKLFLMMPSILKPLFTMCAVCMWNLSLLSTAAVVKAVQCHKRNVVLYGLLPPISNSEKELTRKERTTLAQLRSRYCRLLGLLQEQNQEGCKPRRLWHTCLMMSSISSFTRLTRLHSYHQTYGADRRLLSGNSAISKRETPY